MKVFCINDINDKGKKMRIVIARTYDAIQSDIWSDCYIILEHEKFEGMPCHYSKKFFIPISEIDETTFEREYIKEPLFHS